MVLNSKKKVRALGLCSGGLDSILSALVLQKQGIEVEWISFETPFFSSDKARKASQNTGIPIIVKNITNIYLKMLKNPKCGYGKNMNPCMDCHSLMFNLAGEVMQEKDFDFLFSGEVMGQRPMSQTKTSLRYVEKNSGFDGYIVRPLSIQKLPETIPEKQGLINRESLYDFTGRSRKPQIALAEKLGVSDYPAPGGGCLLTEKVYSTRLKDLFEHQEYCTENDLYLLKYGRHLRIKPDFKLIVGRDEKDNESILKYYSAESAYAQIKAKDIPGPVVLLIGDQTIENIKTAGSVCAGYSKRSEDIETPISVITPEGSEMIYVKSIVPADVRKFMI